MSLLEYSALTLKCGVICNFCVVLHLRPLHLVRTLLHVMDLLRSFLIGKI